MADDYYSTLGVPRDASADAIRKAYRKLSRENHPDVKPGDSAAAATFQKVQEAYNILGDPEKRAQFDRFGANFNRAGGRGGGQWPPGGGGAGGPVDLGEMFGEGFDLGDLFGGFGGRGAAGGRRQPRSARGQDLRAEVQVPFQIAAEGGEVELNLDRDGRPERVAVKIPPGVSEGSVIRLGGQGQQGMGGGTRGDLLLTLSVQPHPTFRREGNHLLVDIPITSAEAALGAKVDAPTLSEGQVVVTIPPGTSSGRKLRLRGKGVIDRKTKERGDLYVVAKIVVPDKLSDEQRKLYEALRDLEANPRST